MRVNRELVPHSNARADVDNGLNPEFDDRRFRDRMRQSDFSSELFISPAHASWVEGRFRLEREEQGRARTDISGVRLQAADSRGEDLSQERQVQTDVVNLIGSLGKLRQLPGLEGAVLSKQALRIRQPIRGVGTRVKFGLRCPPESKYVDGSKAAAACHASIVSSIRRSGFVIEQPKEKFDPAGGLTGLEDWGRE